ncbi:somatolactin beta [Myxocyprinus asiaticus]|uniref:somatolactin beta n=1 Tax=Myxocyprinus asiaticus TaxID=70543 RepID=UPI002222A5CD|nr:somatolactin beta [Myxocyprinus asiaticus]
MFFPNSVNQQVHGGPICASRTVLVPTSKSEIQQIFILAEGGLLLEGPETSSVPFTSPDMFESVRRDYSVLYCFRKDAHKMEIFLKLLKCHQTEKQNCSFFWLCQNSSANIF